MNALSIDDQNRQALGALGRLYRRTEAWDKAVASLVKHAELEGNRGANLWAEAGDLALTEDGDAEAAERYLDKALSIEPEHARALMTLAALHEKKSAWSSAVDDLLRAEAVAPQRGERIALLTRAAEIAEQKLEDGPRAIALLERVLKLDPDNVVAARHGLAICSDEIHADLLLEPGRPHVPIASLAPEVSRRTVTLASPNKTFNFPGTGCAWAIVEDAAMRAAMASEHHATVHDPSLFGYVAALAAYRDGEPWAVAQLDYLRANRDRVEHAVASMPGMAMAHVEATYLAWIDARGLAAPDAHALFLAHGVALSPGAQFGTVQVFLIAALYIS
jgi:tetratricopeptide (TPR) repeat protein